MYSLNITTLNSHRIVMITRSTGVFGEQIVYDLDDFIRPLIALNGKLSCVNSS
jgi:hypothetical protein